jgi:chemotaxis protein CheD
MKTIMIGIGGLDATKEPGASVKTMALGSCVSVVLLDRKTHAVGMAHVALPESKIDENKAKELPGYFADTAVPALIKRMAELGGPIDGRGLIVKLAGGSNVMDTSNTFNIGKRNILALKKTLWKFGLGPVAEDVGGDISRTVEVLVDSGMLKISTPNCETREI